MREARAAVEGEGARGVRLCRREEGGGLLGACVGFVDVGLLDGESVVESRLVLVSENWAWD